MKKYNKMRNKLTFLCIKLLPPLIIQRRTVYLLSVCPLCGGMGMLSVALSLPLAEDCASKKSSWRHLFPRKEKKTLPTSVRDGDRDRPQLSPAAPIGWHFVQNLTQTTSLTTHQQILKAYMQPPSFTPPLSQRFRTSCRRSTLNFYLQWRRLLLLCSGLWYSPFMRQDVVDFYWLLLFLPEDTK